MPVSSFIFPERSKGSPFQQRRNSVSGKHQGRGRVVRFVKERVAQHTREGTRVRFVLQAVNRSTTAETTARPMSLRVAGISKSAKYCLLAGGSASPFCG